MKKNIFKRFFAVAAAAALTVSMFTFGLQASAASDSIVITIESNGDINPLIRFYAFTEKAPYEGVPTFDKGGPFTVSFEWKAEISRMSAKEGMNCFAGIYEMNNDDAGTDGVHITSTTNGWVSEKFTFIDVLGCIDLGAMQPYGVINVGMWYAKGSLSIRNFKITNASGKVMYSIDEDQDLKDLMEYSENEGLTRCSLKDIGIINPTPIILATSFGDNSSNVYLTTDSTSDTSSNNSSSSHSMITEDPISSSQTTSTGSEGTVTSDIPSDTSSDENTSSTESEEFVSEDEESQMQEEESSESTSVKEDEKEESGTNVVLIVVIIAAAVIIVAVAVLYILAAKNVLKINLPFLKK